MDLARSLYRVFGLVLWKKCLVTALLLRRIPMTPLMARSLTRTVHLVEARLRLFHGSMVFIKSYGTGDIAVALKWFRLLVIVYINECTETRRIVSAA